MQKVSIAVVTRKDGKVLVISRRKKESGTDNSILTWTFPKGSDEITEVRWVDPDKIFTLFTTNLDSKTAIYLGVNSKMS